MGQRKASPDDPITPFEHRLVAEYVKCHNKTEAYRRAGGNVKNPKSVSALASSVFQRPRIQQALGIATVMDIERKEQVAVTEAIVLRGMYNEAKREGKGSTHAARVAAWGYLGRYLAIWTDVNVTGEVDLGQMMREAEARVAVGKEAFPSEQEGEKVQPPNIIPMLREAYDRIEGEAERAKATEEEKEVAEA